MLSISRIGPDSQLGQVGVVDVGKNAVSLVWPWDWIDWFGQDPLKATKRLAALLRRVLNFSDKPSCIRFALKHLQVIGALGCLNLPEKFGAGNY